MLEWTFYGIIFVCVVGILYTMWIRSKWREEDSNSYMDFKKSTHRTIMPKNPNPKKKPKQIWKENDEDDKN